MNCASGSTVVQLIVRAITYTSAASDDSSDGMLLVRLLLASPKYLHNSKQDNGRGREIWRAGLAVTMAEV